MQPSSLLLLRKIHRWFSLLLAGLVLFYCFTGLLLNHRKSFHYFTAKTTTTSKVVQSDTTSMHQFIDFYKKQIGRSDDPAVIRIRGSEAIEFLYGSHGKTTYIITPSTGVMEMIQKNSIQPWKQLNDFHKVFKTSTLWLVIADFTCAAILLITISGLCILKYRPVDWVLVAIGCIVPLSFMVF